MPAATAVLSLLIYSLSDLPSAPFNLPGQHRTRTCVEMRGDVVALRFADGTPTGFWAHANDPSQQGSAEACDVGTMEIDAHETLRTADGSVTYFHPGGGPDQYRNYIETGQYGHIAREDLKGAIKLIPSKNGRPAAARSTNARTYFVTPTQIPLDMWYKPNVANGKSGAHYFTYGNPGYDKTGGRGDWTYTSWTWVQNGGTDYPANQGGGGGIARAMLKRGMRLTACDVEPIIGCSYGADNQINGTVTAFYSRTFAGPGESGSAIYGWLPHSYQLTGDVIVPCLRRTPDAPSMTLPLSTLKSSEVDAMVRMANNLLNEVKADVPARKELLDGWAKRYVDETDPLIRMEILTEMSRLDQPHTVAQLLKMLASELDSRVREQIILLLGYMRSTDAGMPHVCRGLQGDFRKSNNERERLRILDVASRMPCPETVGLVRALVPTLGTSVETIELQIAAADAVLRLAGQTPVDELLVDDVILPLQQHAVAAESRGLRARVIRLLAAPGRDQLSFLLGLLETEKSAPVLETINEVTANAKLGQ